jgi:hypothetical protein
MLAGGDTPLARRSHFCSSYVHKTGTRLDGISAI